MKHPNFKQELIRSFDKAAKSYLAHDFMQAEIGNRLLQRLTLLKGRFNNILDAGCGTGRLLPSLKAYYPKSNIIGLDISHQMLKAIPHKKPRRWRKNWPLVRGDVESLPFQAQYFDLIIGNLVYHWCDFERVMTQLKQCLQANGLMLFTLPGPNTLIELKQAFQSIDQYEHVNFFEDMHPYGDCLQKHGFENVVMDVEMLTFHYDNLWQLLKDLKYTGVRNINENRRSTMLSKQTLDNLAKHYPMAGQKYPVTFEVIFGHAICPRPQPSRSHTRIPLTLSNAP